MRTVLIEKYKPKDEDDLLRTRCYFATATPQKEIILCSFSKSGEIRVFDHCLYMGESEEFWFFISDSECSDFYVVAKDKRRNLFAEGISTSPSTEYSSEFRGKIVDQIRKNCPFFEEIIYRNFEAIFLRRAEPGMQVGNKAVFESIKAVHEGNVRTINREIVEFYKIYLKKKNINRIMP